MSSFDVPVRGEVTVFDETGGTTLPLAGLDLWVLDVGTGRRVVRRLPDLLAELGPGQHLVRVDVSYPSRGPVVTAAEAETT